MGEELANSITHVVGSHLGAAMLALVVWQGATSGVDVAWKVTSGSIFGASIILLYVVSSAYHAVTNKKAKHVLHMMDHMAIYFLIAGSYTPFCLVSLRPTHPGLAWSIFGIEWGAALIGVIVKVWTTGRFRYLSTSAYVIMGWAAVTAIVPLIRALEGLGTMSAADSTRSVASSTSGSLSPMRIWSGTSSFSLARSATSSAFSGM